MFERTKNRDERHVDERAYPFFTYSYGGNRSWNSTKEGIRPTTVIQSRSGNLCVCVYCGRIALPIQGRRDNYSRMGEEVYFDKGHCCVCKDAMDELEMQDQIAIIREQYKEALHLCGQAMPKRNPNVLLAMMDSQLEEQKRDLKFHLRDDNVPDYAAERAGFKILNPASIDIDD